MNRKHLKFFADLLSTPTAPLHEHHVAAYIRDFAARRGLKVKEDRFGNLVGVQRRHGEIEAPHRH